MENYGVCIYDKCRKLILMKNLLIPFILIFLFSCGQKPQKEETSSYNFAELQKELAEMAKVDQEVQMNILQNMDVVPEEILAHKRDSVFKANGERGKEIFRGLGLPGIDRVGEKGAKNFWLLVQHCDYDPAFQKNVLEAMKGEVERENASSEDYAYLYDRVRVNAGEKQWYGTQLTHAENMWAIPKPLADSLSVNPRREAIGLESIEAYLNGYMEMHFEMNQAYYESIGATEAFAYELLE